MANPTSNDSGYSSPKAIGNEGKENDMNYTVEGKARSEYSSKIHNFSDRNVRPNISYREIVAKILLNSEKGEMSLREIVDKIAAEYAYYENSKRNWPSSVRHTLSVSDCFVKAGRAKGGRGYKWKIDESFIKFFRQGKFDIKSGSSSLSSCRQTSTPKIDRKSIELSRESPFLIEPITPFVNPTSFTKTPFVLQSETTYIESFDCLIPQLNKASWSSDEGTAFLNTEAYSYNKLMSPIDNYCLDNSLGVFRDCMYSIVCVSFYPNKSKSDFYGTCNQPPLICPFSWTNITVKGGPNRCLDVKCDKRCYIKFHLVHRNILLNPVTIKTNQFTKLFTGNIFQILPNVSRLKVEWMDDTDIISIAYRAMYCNPNKKSTICKSPLCMGNDNRHRGECRNASGQNICKKPLSLKVIITAVIGSLVCSLILVISLGCIRKFHVLERRNSDSQISNSDNTEQTHFMACALPAAAAAPPPPYDDITENSLPFDDLVQVVQHSEEGHSEVNNIRNLMEENYAIASEESQRERRKSFDSDTLLQELKTDDDNRSIFDDERVDISDMLPII
ncbi:DgyrCDS6961 [Dimorphilus gyrociliatus]|uniref:DgyrCDS6961 n=1 Tax=Dimorphilus gyrociliatus TaxID=2664684 RepID=A0A7I8VR92_9ANNE|nr:DgyrCDS6961 [Dimorphilus gyrociliatus]